MLNTRHVLFTAAACLGLTSAGFAVNKGSNFAIVDFSTCIAESKYGKKEQSNFESIKNQLQSMVEDSEKRLSEETAKLQDHDYLDSLSPDAENELRMRYQALAEEHQRYQNQYYQVLNQANMRVVQAMAAHITNASQEVAKELKIPLVVNKEAAFYYDANFDMTALVIERMNKNFEVEAKKETKK